MNTKAVSPIRCAIYTRVSDDQGLEKDFNSLQAQYESGEAYIRSQAHCGWTLLADRYDDGGFSGGDTDRPALQHLLEDIRLGSIDVVVVYKVDRLTRSLADFAKLVELFDYHNVSFASVTQPFNTTTSMGRLTLNVLLSFAQFEREIAGERIRDKMAASKHKGIWVGGPIALGYQSHDGKILVNEAEAEQVRMVFEKYLELGSLRLVMADLVRRGVMAKRRLLKNGTMRGGYPLTTTGICYILRNRCYIGEIVFNGEILKGPHPAIIDREVFNVVQSRMDSKRMGPNKRRPPTQLA
jgi:site-specific DNA recombinase